MKIHTFSLGSFATNCYLVEGENRHAFLIDPASDGHFLYDSIVSLGLMLDAVLLTHGHADHLLGLDELYAHYDRLPLYIGRDEIPYLTDPSLNLSAYLTGMPYLCPFVPTPVSDGETLTLAGLSVKVLVTPGHTDGSACFLAENVIFSGDTLFFDTVGRTDFPHGSMFLLRQSLRRLAFLDGNYTVYPGHGVSTTLARERQYNGYMA